MQAIQTRFLGPTNTRWQRIRAFCQAGSIIMEWDDRANVEYNHAAAARALAIKLGWFHETHGGLFGGQLPNGDYAWVFAEPRNEAVELYCAAYGDAPILESLKHVKLRKPAQ